MNNPFQLCVDARMLFASGIGTCIRNILPHLPLQKIALLIRKEDRFRLEGFSHCTPIVLNSPIYSMREQIELLQKTPPCDLFWSPHYNIPLFPIRACKRFVTIHDAAHLAFGASQSWKQNLYARVMFRQAVLKSDGVLTDSFFSRDELLRYLPVKGKEIQVVFQGLDKARFSIRGTEEELLTLQKKYSLPSRFLLFVGNCKPHKNLKLLVELYEKKLCSLPLVVVGKKEGFLTTDPWVQKIEGSIAMREKIHFVGEVLEEELPLFYSLAEIFLFPSLYEGFGLPPLEAMASRCPVIASSVASLPEVCGDAAHWINPVDVYDLANGISQIVSSEEYKHSLILKGLKQIQKFCWKKTAARYSEIFTGSISS